MHGKILKDARVKQGLTQERLARLAGVRPRPIGAIAQDANVSMAILKRVVAVLGLEVLIGDVSLPNPAGEEPPTATNLILLQDAIREARADAERTQAILNRAENIIEGKPETAKVKFPPLPVRRVKRSALRGT